MKTETEGTVIETLNAGRTELLGTLVYPAAPVPQTQAAFRIVDSRVSLIYSVSSYEPNGDYGVQVEETRGGVTRQVPQSSVRGRMALYVSD